MKYEVTKKCVGCGTCSGICPVNALGPFGPDTPMGRLFAIDADKCVGCASCYRVCPFEAIQGVGAEPDSYVVEPDKAFPREYPLVKNGMPHNLDGSSITMEQWLGEDPEFDTIDERRSFCLRR